MSRYKYTKDEVVAKLNLKYHNAFNFDDIEYIDTRKPIKYTCTVCKTELHNNVDNLLRVGVSGCRRCKGDSKKLNTEKFINLATAVHGDRYDYSNTTYINAKIKVEILCKRCNQSFLQRTTAHLYNQSGCPSCKLSHGEFLVQSKLKKLSIDFIQQFKINECVGIGGRPLVFDFYIPSLNTCIEYDGKQHSDKKSKFWSESVVANDSIKNKYCSDNKIRLIRINYTEIDSIENIIDSLLK